MRIQCSHFQLEVVEVAYSTVASMPGPHSRPQRPSQSETHFSLRDLNQLALSQENTELTTEVVEQWASSQGVQVEKALSRGNVGFLLAERNQVEDLNWWNRHNVGFALDVTGVNSQPFSYPKGKQSAHWAIAYARDRETGLDEVLPSILMALSQGTNVVVHCEHSFHRGPVALCAVLRRLFGLDVGESTLIPTWRGKGNWSR